MDILNSIQDMISKSGTQRNEGENTNYNTGSGGGAGDFLSGLFGGQGGSGGQNNGGLLGRLNSHTNASVLGTSAIGGLVGAFLGQRGLRGAAGGALLGGGLQLLNQYRNRIKQEGQTKANGPTYSNTQSHSTAGEREERIIRAVVYAAKSDGHIDDAEKSRIDQKVKELNLGPEAERLVQQAMNEPLDPKRIAEGVKNPDEALEVFVLSCSVLDVDNGMQRYYLTSLAEALNIPADVSEDLINKIHQSETTGA